MLLVIGHGASGIGHEPLKLSFFFLLSSFFAPLAPSRFNKKIQNPNANDFRHPVANPEFRPTMDFEI